MKTKLRHIAITSPTPGRLQRFYTHVFHLENTATGKKQDDDPQATRTLTDGYIGLFALLARNPGYPGGLDHFGFDVDDLDEVRKRIAELYPSVAITERPSSRRFVGMAAHDPEGHVFDISYPQMGERRKPIEEQQEKTECRFHHLAMRAINPEQMAKFYMDVLDLRLAKDPGADRVFHLTDGVIKFVIMPWRITDFNGTGIVERPTLDHIGFAVPNMAAYREDLATLAKDYPDAAPLIGRRESEWMVKEREFRKGMQSQCEYQQDHLCDPDGILLDVRAQDN